MVVIITIVIVWYGWKDSAGMDSKLFYRHHLQTCPGKGNLKKLFCCPKNRHR